MSGPAHDYHGGEHSVGVRDLSHRTSQVLSRVKAGERLVITDRGEPIAVVIPADDINDVVTVNTRYRALKLGAADSLNLVLAARYGTAVLFTLDHRHYRARVPLTDHDALILLPADRDRWLPATDG